jgi:hypothetical protein
MKDEKTVDREKAVPLLVRAYELGVNYFDTGKWYCAGDSEKSLGEAVKAMDRGRVFISTKYAHADSTAADIRKLVDTGYFESMLCQYNLLGRRREEGMRYAASRGLGVVVMGPVGGGRLGSHSDVLARMLPGNAPVSTPELALRFVLANPSITVALSGMSAMEHVVENVATVSRSSWLTAEERRRIESAAEENEKLKELYCTGCKYCLPCPHGVSIPRIFEAMNYSRVWGLTDTARRMYREIGPNLGDKEKRADACVECGECEPKCPQKIPIIAQLKESRTTLE